MAAGGAEADAVDPVEVIVVPGLVLDGLGDLVRLKGRLKLHDTSLNVTVDQTINQSFPMGNCNFGKANWAFQHGLSTPRVNDTAKAVQYIEQGTVV